MDDSTSGSNGPTKKLKLTLKLGSNGNSSSSSSGSNSSNNSKIPSSLPNSSIEASPVKPKIVVPDNTDNNDSTANIVISELPSGLANLKGRGRPKKAEEVNNSAQAIPQNSTSNNGTTNAPSNADYAAELKSFITVMKTFKPRSWSLNKSIPYKLKTVSGYELAWPCGFWCTNSSNLGSEALVKQTAPSNLKESLDAPAAFEITCQCGKFFTDRSKYRKHVKIHDKPIELVAAQVTNEQSKDLPKAPSISLKIKLNTSNSSK